MVPIKGILLKKRPRYSIIFTPEGEFKRAPFPFQETRLGQEVSYTPRISRIFCVGSLAAVLLIFLLTWQLYQAIIPQAAAYVSLDFGPSVELTLNKKGEIVKISPLNNEGEALTNQIRLPSRDLKEVLTLIMEKELKPKQPQLLVCTYTPAQNKKASKEIQVKVMQTLDQVLRNQPLANTHVVRTLSPQIREEARKNGISPGKYLLHLEAKKQGSPIPLNELKRENWSTLKKRYQDTLHNFLSPEPFQEARPLSSPMRNKFKGKKDLVKELTPPEEQVEEQSQKQTQKQTSNKGKVKGKTPALVEQITWQSTQGRNFSQQEKDSPAQEKQNSENHQYFCNNRKVIHLSSPSKPFSFAEKTPAVLLTVETHLLGPAPTLLIAGPPVKIKKRNAFIPRHLVSSFSDEFVLLPGAD